jgi:hypothetical protein
MIKIIIESICVILKADGLFNMFTKGITWAALTVIVLGALAMVVHYV